MKFLQKGYWSSFLSIFLLLFFALAFLYSSDHSFNQDLGRHIKLGEIIWTTKEIPQTNLFSYTYSDFPFINHHWLFEVAVYAGAVSMGLGKLLIVKVVLLLTAITLILFLAKKYESVFFFPTAFLFLHMLRGRIELRPEIISFLFTALTFYLLEKNDKSPTKLMYLLPAISLLWVNTHIYYPVGIFLQLIYLAGYVVERKIQKKTKEYRDHHIRIVGVITGLSLLATLINPNTLKGALYAFTVFSNYGVTITENQTIASLQSTGFVNPDFLFFYLCCLVIGGAFMIGLIKNAVTFRNAAILVLGLVLASQSIRGFPYLFFLSLPIVVWYLDFRKKTVWSYTFSVIVGLLLIIESLFYLNGSYYQLTYRNHLPQLIIVEDAKPAVDFVLVHKLPQPMFNNFDIGSYLIYRMYPEYKVFIDGRPEAYPAEFFEKTYLPMQESNQEFQNLEKRFAFQTIVFSILDQNPRTVKFLKAVTEDPRWSMVYLDQYMVVYTKKEVATRLQLTQIQLSKLKLSTYNYTNAVAYTNISTFLFNMYQFEKAKEFNKKALTLSPNNPAANKIMANILLRDKHPNLSQVYEYLEKSQNGVFW